MSAWGESDELIVSICCITFNHEKFIADALDGFLLQKTMFPFEIIVRDDASQDSTQKILQEYVKKFPRIIKLIVEKENQYSKGVRPFPVVYKKAKGRYLALCEGDDYWHDSKKLQTQVEFLESNPDFSQCFHKVNVVNEITLEKNKTFPDFLSKNEFKLIDVLETFFIPTLSVLFRKSVVDDIPPLFYQMKNPDWMLHILCAQQGKLGFIDKVMGDYRVHASGVWSGIGRIKVLENTIKSAQVMNEYLNFTYNLLSLIK